MPKYPDNEHSCVCGWTTNQWANLLVHRRDCDSWKEHERGLQHKHGGSTPAPMTPVEEARANIAEYETNARECPYCGRECGNADLMLAHLKSCDDRDARFDREAGTAEWAAKRTLPQVEEFLAHTDLMRERESEFERWCREHDRA